MKEKSTHQDIDSQAVKKHIIAVAEQLFHSKSYEEVSMRDIAAEAGVTTGALYHYFRNKQAILVEAFRNEINEKNLIEQYRNSIDPEKDLIHFLCSEMPELVQRDGMEITRTRVLHITGFEHKTVVDECVLILIEKGQANGVFRSDVSAEAQADLLCALYRSSIYQYCVSTEEVELRQLVRSRIELALSAVKS